jgi:hypothetical protein
VLVTGDKFHPLFFWKLDAMSRRQKPLKHQMFLARANMAAGDIETMCLINELIKKS